MSDFSRHVYKYREALSKAYITAACSQNGIMITDKGSQDLDGLDITLDFYDDSGKKRSIGVQLKTIDFFNQSSQSFSFSIDAQLHNKLTDCEDRLNLLMILMTPKSECDWTYLSTNSLHLNHLMYYHSYIKEGTTTNTTKISINIDRSNVVDPKDFREVCQRLIAEWKQFRNGG